VITNRIRFHLHENVDHAIADELQRHGVDVTVTSEVGWRRATDEVQLAFARDNARVLVTHGEAFLVLARDAKRKSQQRISEKEV
jgi:predicted nuclease of predicted toxin-antitoxin system